MIMRQTVLGLLGEAQHPRTLAEAKRYFAAKELICPDLREIVYRLAIKHGGEEEYNKLLQRYNETDNATEKRRCMVSLAKTPNEELQKKTLEWVFSKDVRSQDKAFPIRSISRTKGGNVLLWSWFKTNFDDAMKHLEKFSTSLTNSFIGSVTYFNTEEMANEVEEFFKAHPIDSASRGIKQSLERIRGRAEQRKRDLENLRVYFAK